MLDRAVFMETLREVAEIAASAAQPLSREEILDYFRDMELDESQKELVFNYILTPHDETKPDDADDVQETAAQDISEDSDKFMQNSLMFQMYLEEMQKLRKYSDVEMQNMYKRLCKGDSSVIPILSESWLETVYEMAKKHLSDKYSLEDVIQEGNIGLFIELDKICKEKRTCDVAGCLADAVEQAMKAYISEITGLENSENTIVGKVQLVNEARKYLMEQNSVEPSNVELAEFTRIPEGELADILNLAKKAQKKQEF